MTRASAWIFIGDRRAYDVVVRLMAHGAAAAATAGDTDHATTTLSTAVVLVLELYEQAEVGVTLRWQPRTGLALNPHAHANQLAKQLAGDTTKGCNVSLELRADGLLDVKGLTVDGMQGRLRDMFTPESFVTCNADIPPN